MARFPFRRSVGQNLRQLFAHDRLLAQSNQLGYSSLSPGEGSAEVRDAAGATLAHFGHAGGKSGFLVPNGSGWQTVQEATAAAVAAGTSSLTTRMTNAEGRLDSHASRIGAAEGDIDAVESVNATQNGRLDSHAQRLGATETRANDAYALAEKLGANGVLESPTLNAPKIGKIASGPLAGNWKALIIDPSTGQVRYMGD